MKRILFVCHGNICRSAAAKVVMRQMIREEGLRGIEVDSAAATREEIGHDIYPPMKRALKAKGYACEPHRAKQTVQGDYDRYDYLIGMDWENMEDMRRIYRGDPEKKITMLREWAGAPGAEIEDPWYTGRYDLVLKQIETGCEGLLRHLLKGENDG